MSAPTTPKKSRELDEELANLTPKWKKDAMMGEFKVPPNKDQKRRLILDEDKFEEAFLKCMVCQEPYDRVTHVPKLLSCQHNVCLSCLLEMFRVESEFRVQLTSAYRSSGPSAVKITCPACRQSLVKSEAEIRDLTTDVTLLELGEFIRSSERCVVSFCHRHSNVPMNFFCDTCKQQICSECTTRDHGQGHDVIGVDTAVKETLPEIDASLDLAVTESSTIARTRQTLESVIIQLDAAMEEMTHDLFATFNTFKNAPESRAQELIEISHAEIDSKREYLVKQLQIVRKREAELNASRCLLQEARSNDDLDQMFVHHQIIKQKLSEQVPLPVCNQEEIRCLLSFMNEEEEEETFEEVRGVF